MSELKEYLYTHDRYILGDVRYSDAYAKSPLLHLIFK